MFNSPPRPRRGKPRRSLGWGGWPGKSFLCRHHPGASRHPASAEEGSFSLLLFLLLLLQVPAGLQGQTGVVTGVLRTDTGLPLEGVRVAVTPANPALADSVLESLGLTDSTGRYRLENVSPGRYNILVGRGAASTYHPGVVALDRATTIQVLAASTIEVPDMVYGGKHVSGRVVDLATGNARRILSLVLCCDYPLPAATVADDGSFVFPSVPPGNYSLTASDPAVIQVSWPVAVSENHITGLQLDVSEGVEVQGTVLDQSGQPVKVFVGLRPSATNAAFNTTDVSKGPANVGRGLFRFSKEDYASLERLRDRLFKSAQIQSGPVGPDGRFAFQKVYPGAYTLEVSTTGVNLLQRDIQVGSTGLTNLSLQVPAIQVTGRVVAPSSGPLPKLNYIRLVRSGAAAEVFYGFPDAQGHFVFLLVPGEYRVFTDRLGPSVQSVSDGSRDITNTEFRFEGGGTPQIIVTLAP